MRIAATGASTGYPLPSGKPGKQGGAAAATGPAFVERGVNVLAFGLPGTGKTHALCALGHRLVEAGHSVLFAPAYGAGTPRRQARSGPAPPARKLDNFDCSWTTSTCPSAEESGSSSPSSPNATSAGRWASRQTWSSPSGSASLPTPWPPPRRLRAPLVRGASQGAGQPVGQSKMQGPGGWQDQPSIVDQAVVVEGDLDAVGVLQW